jgi:putative transposase
MELHQKSSPTVYDLKYQLVWITRYCKPILMGEIATGARELLKEIAKPGMWK